MTRRFACFLALAAVLTASASPAAPAGAPQPASAHAAGGSGPPRLQSVTLHIFNRVFGAFHDKVVAVPHKPFRVGDTEYTARIVRFEPDFTLDLKTHKISSVTQEPNNPAFQIVVSRGTTPHDTTWAFFNTPPHFNAKSQLAFVATRIEFTNRPALVSKDSLALKIQQREGGAH